MDDTPAIDRIELHRREMTRRLLEQNPELIPERVARHYTSVMTTVIMIDRLLRHNQGINFDEVLASLLGQITTNYISQFGTEPEWVGTEKATQTPMQTKTSPKAGERTQFTPGPWMIYQDHPDPETARSLAYIRPANTQRYSSVELASVHLVDNPERMANARLIAAAPELLDALQSLVTATQHPGRRDDIPDARINAIIAIRLAEEGKHG